MILSAGKLSVSIWELWDYDWKTCVGFAILLSTNLNPLNRMRKKIKN